MIDIAKIQQAILLTQQGKIQEAKNIYENEKGWRIGFGPCRRSCCL